MKKTVAILALGAMFLPLSCTGQEEDSSQLGSSDTSQVSSSEISEDEIIEDRITISLDELKGLREEGANFGLVAHRATCPYCQAALPFLLDYMEREFEREEEDPSYQPLNLFLISTQDSQEVVDYLSDLLIPIADEDDIAAQTGTLYVPNLSVFIDGEPESYETGLPQYQEAMDQRLNEVKELIA